jgi:hypothetical protein
MALLIDRPPQGVALPMERAEDLVQVPLVSRPGTPTPQLIGERLATWAALVPDGFIGHINPASKQQLFAIAIAEAEAVIEPYTSVEYFRGNW